MCGAVLLGPLALSSPGGDAPVAVVLAAGAPGGVVAAEAVGLAVDFAAGAEVADAPGDEPAATRRRPRPRPVRPASAVLGRLRPGAAKATASSSSSSKAAAAARSEVTPAATAAESAAPASLAAQTPTPAPAPPPPPPPPPPAPARAAPQVSSAGAWDRLAVCESGNTNDHGAPYYGYWQFSAATWQGLGEPGLPDEHPRERQLAVAMRLQAVRGWAPWPACSRRLGLL